MMEESKFGKVRFFFNDTATTEIYTLSLHDALPIYSVLYQHTASSCDKQTSIW